MSFDYSYNNQHNLEKAYIIIYMVYNVKTSGVGLDR